MKITKATVKGIQPAETDQWVWDSTMPGFGIRVWPSGRAVYVMRYRTVAGTQRKLTIGDARVMDPDEARDRARKAIVASRDGKDPQKERARARRSETIADLCVSFLEHHKVHVKPGTYRATKTAFILHILPAFGSIKCTELTGDDVAMWHQRQTARYAANRAVKALSVALNWAVEIKGWMKRSPIKSFRYYSEKKRQMILTPEQMRVLLATLDAEETPRWAAPYLIKMLLITGLRCREWGCAQWSQFNDAAGTLSLDDEQSKTGARSVQLGDDARIMLRQIRSHPRAHPKWIFPNADGRGPMKNPYSFWYNVIRKAGLPLLRIHDLRHTFASYGLLAGANIKEVQQMLGHRKITTTERYIGVFDDRIQSAQSKASRTILNVAMTGQLPDADRASRHALTVAR